MGRSSATAEDRPVRSVVTVSLIAFAATAPPPADDRFTETSLVAENDDGNPTTATVPRDRRPAFARFAPGPTGYDRILKHDK